jgi:hypothetical protein
MLSVKVISTIVGTIVTSKSLLELSGQIYGSIAEIVSYEDEYVNRNLENLDIESKLRIIDVLMQRLQKQRREENQLYELNKKIEKNKETDMSKIDNLKIDNSKIDNSKIDKKETNDIELDDLSESIIEKARIEKSYIVLNQSEDYDEESPIEASMRYLYEITHKMYLELENIRKVIRDKKTMYFSWWRSQPISPKIEVLKMHKRILNDRFNTLLKMLAIDFSTNRHRFV